MGAGPRGAGDEVVVTAMDHHATFVTWQQLARERGAAFRVAELTPDGRIDLEELDERLEATYAARTYADLVPITADLPVAGRPSQPAPVAATTVVDTTGTCAPR